MGSNPTSANIVIIITYFIYLLFYELKNPQVYLNNSLIEKEDPNHFLNQ